MDNRLFFPATRRNKKYIGDILSRILYTKGSVLEIGSGSGEHAIEFQKRFPEIIWQTSDPELEHRKSIKSWIDKSNLNIKMPQPLAIDVTIEPWQLPSNVLKSLLGIISINMIHIAPWNCTKSLFKRSNELLNNDKFLMLYGPFKIKNKHISQSNELFDKSLKLQNENWGVINLDEVNEEARVNGFFENELIEMPANNFIIIYRKMPYKLK